MCHACCDICQTTECAGCSTNLLLTNGTRPPTPPEPTQKCLQALNSTCGQVRVRRVCRLKVWKNKAHFASSLENANANAHACCLFVSRQCLLASFHNRSPHHLPTRTRTNFNSHVSKTKCHCQRESQTAICKHLKTTN